MPDNLLRVRGFLPYIATIFLNAFVDLGHKVTVQNTVFKTHDGDALIILTAIVNALILLPFVLLFTPAGYLSDKFPKNRVMRTTAWGVVALTSLIAFFYHLGWFWAAFAMTLLLAVQSAVYSPAKYGYIKEIVGTERLARANGVVQAATTTAILGGTFVFSVLFELFLADTVFSTEKDVLQAIAPIGWFLVAGAIVELLLAYRLPKTRKTDESLRFDWKKYRTGRYLSNNLAMVKSHQVIFLCIVGLALIWAIGQVLLAAFPAFAKQNLGVYDARVVQGMLASAGIGIILGSIIAGRISRNHIETGLMPVGSLGVAVCLLLLPGLESVPAHSVNILLLGIFSGLFIIPLNALLQFHAGEQVRGRVLAGNSFIQNVVMLSFLVLTVLVSLLEVSNLLFPLLTAAALCGACYTMYKLPQSLARLAATLAGGYRHRLAVQGFNHFPDSGGVLMLGGRTRPGDWAYVQVAAPRQVRFLVDGSMRGKWYSKKFFEFFRAIPGAPDPSTRQAVIELLDAGEVVCPWFGATADDADWLTALRNDRDKPGQWVTLPFSLDRAPGGRASSREVTVSFGKPA